MPPWINASYFWDTTLEAISKMPNGPISASCRPDGRRLFLRTAGEVPPTGRDFFTILHSPLWGVGQRTVGLTSNHFSFFETASSVLNLNGMILNIGRKFCQSTSSISKTNRPVVPLFLSNWTKKIYCDN